MKLISLIALGAMCASSASAGCFVEYKAKQDDPLVLHYGFLELPAPCPDDPIPATADRLLAAGWTLLTVQSAAETDPTPEQKENAGDNFLRY